MALYIDRNLQYNRRCDLENVFNGSNAEVIFIEVPSSEFNTKPIVIAEIYRPPGTSIPDFNNCIDQCLTLINEDKKLFYLLGDFNINLFNVKHHVPTANFMNTMFSHLGVPLINRPTRLTSSSATLIDHIYTNAIQLLENKSLSGVLCVNISDHLPIFHLCNSQSNVTVKIQAKPRRVINTKTLNKLKTSLEKQDWSTVMQIENTHKAYNAFTNVFMKCYNECIPITEKCHNVRHKAWVTSALLNSIKRKNKLYVQYCKNRCSVTEARYKSYKNKLTQLLRKAEKDYVSDYINKYKTEARKMWSLINDKLGKGSPNTTLPEMCEGEEKVLANRFNAYFTNVGPTLADSIKDKGDPLSDMGSEYKQSMYVKPVSEKELVSLINELKNCSAGIDCIKASVVKAVKGEIMTPLLYLLNKSLQTGIFPDALKVAVVTPVYKKGCKNSLSNYRPVSVLTVFSKLFEKAMNNRIVEYLEKHNVLYQHQYGFRKGYSTDLALSTVVDFVVKALQEKKIVCGIYMDLSKAFDTINHSVLKQKLKHYGINGPAYQWISNYLTDRKQVININGTYSESNNLTCGVPQGSILGPTLFLIYVNDIYRVSQLLNFVLFADDTNLFKSGDNINALLKDMNSELTKVSKWFKSNQLTLNISKTHFMIFSRKYIPNVPNVYIDKAQIGRVKCSVFLGVHIDDTLCWKNHVSHVLNKVNKGIGILYKLRNVFPKQTLLQIYKSLIYPHFNYCNIVWGSCNQSVISELYKAQKRSLKVALKLPIRTSTEYVFNTAHVITLAGINRIHTAIFMYKYHNDLLPSTFRDKFHQVCDVHHYNLRTSTMYVVPMAKSKLCRSSIHYRAPKLWNSLPNVLKQSVSLSSFKTNVKNFFL